MTFDLAFKLVLQLEGNYSNDPDDHGGATNFGIIQKEYDRYRGTKDLTQQSVKNITLTEAKEIYYFDYWLKGKCDVIDQLDKPNLAIYHFQSVVNFGISGGNQLLQRALGISDDGIIGKITIGEVNKQTEFNVIFHYWREQRNKYRRIVSRNETQKKFLNGWFNRTDRTLKFLNIELTESQRGVDKIVE